jgi:hypothetical protein
MAIISSILDDHRGNGRGHTEHGNGKGLGHEKHAEAAAADGVYGMSISGISHINATAVDQVSPPTVLADGSTLTTEVRSGSITIADAPDAALGAALRLETDSDTGRLRVNDVFDADQQFTLGQLNQLGFDYYVESSDRTDVIPTIRLVIDADGNLATTDDRGELVFEYAYQGEGPVTQDTAQHADLTGDDWVAWQRSGGVNRDQIVNMTELSDWSDTDGFTPTDGLTFNEDSVVLGFAIAYGSGNGAGVMYIDDLQVGGVSYDFV